MAYYPDFKHLMTTPQYGFLRTEPRLGRRIMLLGLGGSYAYGTNNENSDIDFRGITLNMPSDLIGLTEFEQYEDSGTDTVIYSFNKMVHMPLRDYENMWSIMHSVVKDYDKIGKRNKKKDDNHLNKHAMHLIRLFMMAVDILEKGEIRTNRKSDLNLLLRIRAGGFQKEDGTFDSEFYDILRDYEERLEMATKNTSLPDNPDMEKVEAFVEYVNRKAIEGDY